MNFKGKGRKNKGITLIALVVTIIVLLILAGVTIEMLSGDNSAPQKATEAAQKDAIAGAKDEIAMTVQERLLNYYNNTYVKGNGIAGASTQSEVVKAADDAVGKAKERNKQLLDSSVVKENTIILKTKSYIVVGTIDKKGGITWSDVNTRGGEIIEETNTSNTVLVNSFANLNEDASLPSDKNTIVKKGTGEDEQKIVIPAGFEVSEGTTLEGGIVIRDAGTVNGEEKAGNEFVWVPVEQKIKFHDGEIGVIQLGRYDFGTKDEQKLEGPKEGNEEIGMNYNSSDKATENSNSVARAIEEFKTQTKLAKGYYIGRYEMGKSGDIAVCKKGVSVYNNVTRDQGKEASQNLYNNVQKEGTTIYTSDLINSYAWDTAVVYIMKTTGKNEYAYQGDGSNKLSNTGEKGDEKCKINDMAKNVFEWTTEYCSSPSTPCVARGTDYTSSNGYTSYRSMVFNSYSVPRLGFRPILYTVGLNT